MQGMRSFGIAIIFGCSVFFGASLQAQTFPSKTLRIITSEAGAANDLLARYIAQGITGPIGQPVIVENRGGNFVILARELMAAAPDGHTTLFNSGTIWVQALLEKVPYDPVADFAPVVLVSRSPNILVVHPSLPVNNAAEFVAYAKARPGQLNYASGINGSGLHIAAELFKSMAGVDLVRVPYKGMGPAMLAVVANETQVVFAGAIAVPPLVKAGKLKALGVTSAQRSPLLPDLAPVAEAVPGYETGLMQGLFAPGKTPAAVIRRLNDEIVKVLKQPAARDRFQAEGADIVASTPEEFAAARKADIARVERLLASGALTRTEQ